MIFNGKWKSLNRVFHNCARIALLALMPNNTTCANVKEWYYCKINNVPSCRSNRIRPKFLFHEKLETGNETLQILRDFAESLIAVTLQHKKSSHTKFYILGDLAKLLIAMIFQYKKS